MKPQCNTSAECLRELARVMDQFGFDDYIEAAASKYVRYEGHFLSGHFPLFARPDKWQFAIAEVEGKPVFLYDTLFDAKGVRCQAIDQSDALSKRVLVEYGDKSKYWLAQSELSWNPPKPATVMVEIPYEVAEFAAINWARHDHLRLQAIGSCCKTALEKLK